MTSASRSSTPSSLEEHDDNGGDNAANKREIQQQRRNNNNGNGDGTEENRSDSDDSSTCSSTSSSKSSGGSCSDRVKGGKRSTFKERLVCNALQLTLVMNALSPSSPPHSMLRRSSTIYIYTKHPLRCVISSSTLPSSLSFWLTEAEEAKIGRDWRELQSARRSLC